MKTIAKIFVAVSVLIFSAQAFAGKGSSTVKENEITYQVTVHMDKGAASLLPNVYVIITSQDGSLIAPAQILVPGKSVYIFSEVGPVKGTRVARVTNGIRPHNDMFTCKEASKTGIFYSGSTYLFDLYLALPVPEVMVE